MEDLLIFALEALLEIALELGAYLPWERLFGLRDHPDRDARVRFGLVSAAFGAALGLASLLVLPRTVFHHSALRTANLIGAPLAAGMLARRSLRRRRQEMPPKDVTFVVSVAVLVTLGFVLVRFLYAARPGHGIGG